MIKFDIKNRWSGLVKFTAEIDCKDSDSHSLKVRLAVAWKIKHDLDANLTRADLTGANLTGADLTGADLTRADLTRADLTGADLTGAKLTGADLTDANLTDANLTRANLTRANLTRADLTGANLTGANLTRANLTRADLTRADLMGAKRDFFAILMTAIPEIPFLKQALINGNVDGSTYNGECACLVGTIAKARNCPVNTLERDPCRPAERFFMAIKRGDTPETNAACKIALDWTNEAILLTSKTETK